MGAQQTPDLGLGDRIGVTQEALSAGPDGRIDVKHDLIVERAAPAGKGE